MKRDESIEPDIGGIIASALAAVLFLVGFVVLAVRLWRVQISETSDYGYANAHQSVRRVQTAGERGSIYDRNGTPLAVNRPSYDIVLLPANFQRKTHAKTVRAILETVRSLSGILRRPSPLTEKDVETHLWQKTSLPLVAWRDVGERELAVFSEHGEAFRGFVVREGMERKYPCGRLAAHVIGYVGREGGDAPAGDEKFNFTEPEMRGRAGLEIYYDSLLRGVSGERQIVVDASGYAVSETCTLAPQRGLDLRLSLDARLQAAAEAELAGLKGAYVALDPRTGEVLALASMPGFNPNEFVPVLRPELYRRYADDPAKPLLNRACGGAYAPGSTFKPITALAGLSIGYPPKEEYECAGFFELGPMRLHCASRWGHGLVDMRHALMKSCNPYFCNLAMDVGTNAIVTTARAFGLGSRTGIDFGIDRMGVVPDADWKMRTYGEIWYGADLAQMSIGQGMLLVSPLQMARVAGAIGTGFLVTPHLKAGLPVERKKLPFPKKNLDIVREGMKMVVNGDGTNRGTGWRAGVDVPVTVCGKTGTAEVGKGETRRKNVWFIAFAPAEDPRIALSVIVENGESGGGTAAPKANAVLRAFFE